GQLRGVARDDPQAGQVVVRREDRRGLAEVGGRLCELAHLQVDHPGQMQRPGKVEAVRAGAVHSERFAGGRERTLEDTRVDLSTAAELKERRHTPARAAETGGVANALPLLAGG